jgi:hypothetical protein
MQNQAQLNPMVLKIIWGALTFSILLYGFVLYLTQKITFFAAPEGALQPLEMLALGYNFMAIVSLVIHRTVLTKKKSLSERFPLYIVCWALNESIAILAFGATFVEETGNSFFFVTNAFIALTANFLTFPKEP